MTKTTLALLGVAAWLFPSTPVFASPTPVSSAMIIAAIGRDTLDLTQPQEVLPTVWNLNIEYPEILMVNGMTGTTIVAVSLDRTGKLLKTRVYHSSGNKLLDTQATYAVEAARFAPGTIDGKPVSGDYSVRINFGN